MLHTDGNNPSQPLHLTSLALVEKEAPEWGVGCAGPWLSEQNGGAGRADGGVEGGNSEGTDREGWRGGMAERKGDQGGEEKCLSESPPVLSTL